MTLAIAILGLVLALASLLWQVWTWRSSGPRLVVSSANTFPVFGGMLGDHHVAVSVENRGRAPATIEGWGFELPNKEKTDFVMLKPPAWATPLPHRLEPHAAAQWMMEVASLRVSCAANGIAIRDLKPWVRASGLGKVYGKSSPPVTD